ncbi:unnamed protein product, partial [Phaeothamnion confervicola]
LVTAEVWRDNGAATTAGPAERGASDAMSPPAGSSAAASPTTASPAAQEPVGIALRLEPEDDEAVMPPSPPPSRQPPLSVSFPDVMHFLLPPQPSSASTAAASAAAAGMPAAAAPAVGSGAAVVTAAWSGAAGVGDLADEIEREVLDEATAELRGLLADDQTGQMAAALWARHTEVPLLRAVEKAMLEEDRRGGAAGAAGGGGGSSGKTSADAGVAAAVRALAAEVAA